MYKFNLAFIINEGASVAMLECTSEKPIDQDLVFKKVSEQLQYSVGRPADKLYNDILFGVNMLADVTATITVADAACKL